MLTQNQPAFQSSSPAVSLLHRFQAVRSATMRFCAPLTPEDMMVQSCAEASPVKWHLAHTTWFFETFILADFVAGYQPFDPNFRWLFNSYYKALGEMPEKKLRASFSRPPLDLILAYRRHVEAAIEHLLQQHPEDEVLRRVALGLEHEQQHLELAATDIKHAFFTNPLQPAYTQAAPPQDAIAPPLDWISYSPGYPLRPGVVEVGITPDPAALDSFAFDNETPRHAVYIAPFRLATRAVTCAEYLTFMEEGGYARPELWLSEGWDTMQREAWQAPLYWRRDPGGPTAQPAWSIFTLHGWRSLGELSETPVCHLSYFEADAFARWSGYRLPTEFEWEFVAAQTPVAGNLLDSGTLHPCPATSDRSPLQMYGDVWEWTQSPYTGYPGYKPLPGALGEYNGKFMSSQMVLRGGSCVTPLAHIRATYRNFFHPATRWQFAGLRLARDGAS
jgi:ergothioneine biosynthesis protein EgtB